MEKNISENFTKANEFDWGAELGGFNAAGYDPKLLKHSPDAHGLNARHHAIRQDFKRLLGPLMPALLRDADGALDVSKISAKDRAEFFKFLRTQAELNDHKAFSDPYQGLLEDRDFSELLCLLYQEVDPDYSVYVSASEADELLKAFQSRLIEIDADHFAQSHLNSSFGRKRIQGIFADPSHYSLDERADLAKAVARVNPDWEHFITQKISLWNYWNIGVSEEDVGHASGVAEVAIEITEERDRDLSKRNELYFEAPSQVIGPQLLDEGLGRKIKPAEIKEMESLRREAAKSLDPILQLKGRLAALWLLAVDTDRFAEPRGDKAFGLNVWLIEETERWIAKADRIDSDEELEEFNDKLQDFLKDGIPEPQENSAVTWVKHQAVGTGLKERFEGKNSDTHAPFDALVDLSDRWKYALDCEEAILTKKTEVQIEDPKLKEAVTSLIQGLEQTKQELWYGYKQHKALSRGISQIANTLGSGDIGDIEEANKELDHLIKKLKRAENSEDVQIHIDKLQELMEEGKVLNLGFKAAEMSGSEQVLGLIQTVGILLAAASATKGLSLVVQGSAVVARGPAAVAAIRNFVTGMTALRPVQGFLWGAGIATMENAIAVSTGEVRVERDTIEKWLKDAISTGAAMSLVMPAAKALGGQVLEQHVLKELAARYLSQGPKGALNLLADTGLEAVEEVVDQYVRQALDGNYQALSLSELQEITKICLAGGGLQIGAVARSGQGQKVPVETKATKSEVTNTRSIADARKTLRRLSHPLLAPALMLSGVDGFGSGLWSKKEQGLSDEQFGELRALLGPLWPKAQVQLAKTIQEMKNTGWSQEQKFELLELVTVVARKTAVESFQQLSSVLSAMQKYRWDGQKIYQALISIARHAEMGIDIAFEQLPPLLSWMEERGWKEDIRIRFIGDMARLEKGNVSDIFQHLKPAFDGLDRLGWSFEQKLKFVYELAETGNGDQLIVGFEHFVGLKTLGWSADQTFELLHSLMKKGRDALPYNLPRLLNSLNSQGWTFEECLAWVRRLASAAKGYSGSALELAGTLLESDPFEDVDRTLDLVFRFLACLTDYNRWAVLRQFAAGGEGPGVFFKLGSRSIEHFQFYTELLERHPRLGVNILEGLLEATEKDLVSPDLSREREKILRFVERTHGFIPALYQAYLQEGKSFFLKLTEFSQALLDDELGMKEIQEILQKKEDAYLLGLIQSASPTSGASFVDRKGQLGLLRRMLGAGDLRSHIPAAWRGKLESFTIDQGEYDLRPGQALDAEGKIGALVRALQQTEKPNRQNADVSSLTQALEEFLRSGRNPAGRERVRERLFELAGQDEEFRERIRQIRGLDYSSLGLLETLLGDKDSLPKLLRAALEKVPEESVVVQGRKQPIKGDAKSIVKSLKKVWGGEVGGKNLAEDEKLTILASILKAFEAADIEAKILSRDDLEPDLKDAIRRVMHEMPTFGRKQILEEILADPLRQIREEKAKYQYLHQEELTIGLRAVKGPAYGLHGLSSGVCTAPDFELWRDPNFKLLAISDEGRSQVLGYVHVHETEIEGRKYLTLPGINPSAEFLSTVDGKKLYPKLIEKVVEFAKAGGYEGVYIPAEPDIHSNRGQIQSAIKKAAYPIKAIPNVHWNSLPKPFPFSEVYVVWEKTRTDENPGGALGLFLVGGAGLATFLGASDLQAATNAVAGATSTGSLSAFGIVGGSLALAGVFTRLSNLWGRKPAADPAPEMKTIKNSIYREHLSLSDGRGKKIAEAREQLKSRDARQRRKAIDDLAVLGAKEAIPDLWEMLRDSDATTSHLAFETLQTLGAMERLDPGTYKKLWRAIHRIEFELDDLQFGVKFISVTSAILAAVGSAVLWLTSFPLYLAALFLVPVLYVLKSIHEYKKLQSRHPLWTIRPPKVPGPEMEDLKVRIVELKPEISENDLREVAAKAEAEAIEADTLKKHMRRGSRNR